MLKEIHEQPDAVAETITDRLPTLDGVDLSDVELDDDFLRGIDRIVIVACGTSYHAGLVGRYAIEQWARVPVEMDIASEYRYRDPVHRPNDLVIGITQSGETADTLAAMRLAKEGGSKVLAISNVMGSQATRDADAVLFTRSGIEISVAATKTFVSQVAAMYLLGAAPRGAARDDAARADRGAGRRAQVAALTSSQETIVSTDERVRAIARSQHDQRFFMYIGRHIGLSVCLEGALKLKEISYIPADAYAAGEMKHGPIALLDESTPVVAVATDSPMVEKMLSNMEEVRARGADVIAVATEGSEGVAARPRTRRSSCPAPTGSCSRSSRSSRCSCSPITSPARTGLNVDQPRNLAKTVTVESSVARIPALRDSPPHPRHPARLRRRPPPRSSPAAVAAGAASVDVGPAAAVPANAPIYLDATRQADGVAPSPTPRRRSARSSTPTTRARKIVSLIEDQAKADGHPSVQLPAGRRPVAGQARRASSSPRSATSRRAPR